MTEPIKINYVIGHYWYETNQIGTYTIWSRNVWYDTVDQAKETLEYVKKQSPDNDWRIFQLMQVLT